MSEPRVSVVMPFRDAGATVGRAVESILAQTLEDIELIAVDDCSRDDGPETVGVLASRDGRVRLVPCAGEGLVNALNTGCDAARSPLIARMDADDWSHPRRLELQVALMDTRPELTLCGCLVRATGQAQPGIRRYVAWSNSLAGSDEIATARFVESPFVHPSVMMRAVAFRAAGRYRDDGLPEDYDLWLRMLACGHGAKVPEVLLDWTDHPQRLTRANPRYSLSSFLRCKARHLASLPSVRARGVVISGAGPTGKELARHLAAGGVTVHAFADVHPRRTGRHIGGVPVLAADGIARATPGCPVQVIALGRPDARSHALALLTSLGYREGDTLWCAS